MVDSMLATTILCVVTGVLFIIHTVGYFIASFLWSNVVVQYFAPAGGKCSLLTATACLATGFSAMCFILGVIIYLFFRFSCFEGQKVKKILGFVFIGFEFCCLVTNLAGALETRHWDTDIPYYVMFNKFAYDAWKNEFEPYVENNLAFQLKFTTYITTKYGGSLENATYLFLQAAMPYAMNIAFLVMQILSIITIAASLFFVAYKKNDAYFFTPKDSYNAV